MRVVKLSTVFPWFPLRRQTPGGLGVWGGYQFTADPAPGPCDAWVVYNNLGGGVPETALVPRERTVLLFGEPPSARIHLDPAYAAQFSTFVGCHPGLGHPGFRFWQQGLPWWAGLRRLGPRQFECALGYDELAAMARVEKTREISIVCSNLIITPEHRQRVRFVRRLAEHFGDRLALYGEGFRPVPDKWDAIAPFKYHITLENSRLDHYWTEKLADAFLGGALPIYYGCPNIGEYFPEDSLLRIDIYRPEESIAAIERALAEGLYEQSLAAVWEARRRVLQEHNLFALLAKLLDGLPQGPAETVVLHPTGHYKPGPAARLRRLRRLAQEGISRACFKTFG